MTSWKSANMAASETNATPPPSPTPPTGTQLYVTAETGIVDEGPNSYTITAVNGTTRSSAVKKIGSWSVSFPDTTNNNCFYVSGQTFLNDSLSCWQFQCWAYFNTNPSSTDTGQLVDQYVGGASGRMIFGIQSGKIDYRVNGGSVYLSTGAGSVTTSTWYHVLLNWDGTTHRLFLDGVLKDSTTLAPAIYTGKNTEFGGGQNLSNYDLNGYMDEILVESGNAARIYTSNFTPSTTQWT